ncbi:Lysophospholipase 1 [Quaeritorhiza haematococci]|nr:Lysophospholipase 1 [Quaeritorhiza haematococci]
MLRNVSQTQTRNISQSEKQWIDSRTNQTRAAWRTYLNQANLSGLLDVEQFVSQERLPRVALTFSGGGLRAMLVSAGTIMSLDARNTTATSRGTGGILQSSSYFGALSGSSWLLGALYNNGFPTIPDLFNWNILKVNHNILLPTTGRGIIGTVELYSRFGDEVKAKNESGFNTTMGSCSELSNSSDYGVNQTFSALMSKTPLVNHDAPFPLVVVNEVIPPNIEHSRWEISPLEAGSWETDFNAFVPTNILGSQFINDTISNQPPWNGNCTYGFDNLGFVVGTSSSIFSEIVTRLNDSHPLLPDRLFQWLSNKATAIYPNPFLNGSSSSGTSESNNTNPLTESALDFVDGGIFGGSVPIWEFVQPARDIDVIIAMDASSNTDDNWPNGTALINAAIHAQQNNIPFPQVPATADEFMSQNLSNFVTFFGCNQSLASTNGSTTSPPIIIYNPNRPITFDTNFSTFKVEYSDNEIWGALDNGFQMMSPESSAASNRQYWSTCLACALVAKSVARAGNASVVFVPGSVCGQCFQEYCWPFSPGSENRSNDPTGTRRPPSGFASGASAGLGLLGSYGSLGIPMLAFVLSQLVSSVLM